MCQVALYASGRAIFNCLFPGLFPISSVRNNNNHRLGAIPLTPGLSPSGRGVELLPLLWGEGWGEGIAPGESYLTANPGRYKIDRLAEVAQVVEHGTENAGVDSSSLSLGTTTSEAYL